jgi:hypothetical protein
VLVELITRVSKDVDGACSHYRALNRHAPAQPVAFSVSTGELYVFGGVTGTGGACGMAWYAFATSSWSTEYVDCSTTDSTTQVPPALSGMASVYYAPSQQILIFGGMTTSGAVSTTVYRFDIGSVLERV